MEQTEFEAKLRRIPVEKPDATDLAMLSEAEAVNDGATMTLDAFKHSLEDYSGRLNIRIPKSLHRRLSEGAKADGVSLNQYILYKLAQ